MIDIEQVPLDRICLLVAREKYPEMDLAHYLSRLDEFASRATHHVANVQGGRQVIQALNHYLFSIEGFQGNTTDYYNPSNSLLNDVLDRRTGIPITLSIIYMEIGRRLGIPLSGAAFPGHFLVCYKDQHETFFIDPFHGGNILTEDDCKKMLYEMYGDQILFRPELLHPAPKRQILLRILANLKIIYVSKKDFETALRTLNHMLLFDPYPAEMIKERGMIHYELECYSSALKDFQAYLVHQPAATDRPFIEECIEELQLKVEQMS